MKQYYCISRFKENNNIWCYRLLDIESHIIYDINTRKLKEAIINGSVSIINMNLTKDKKLVIKKENNTSIPNLNEVRQKKIDKLKNYVYKAKLLGTHRVLFESTFDEETSYLIDTTSYTDDKNPYISCNHDMNDLITESYLNDYKYIKNLVLYIPDEAVSIKTDDINSKLVELTQYGSFPSLNVIGGRNLRSIERLFQEVILHDLNMIYFCTENLVSMDHTFMSSKIRRLIWETIKTPNLRSMNATFYFSSIGGHTGNIIYNSHKEVIANGISMRGINTANVQNMRRCFSQARIEYIDFCDIKIQHNKEMFDGSKIHYIDAKNQKTKDLINVLIRQYR